MSSKLKERFGSSWKHHCIQDTLSSRAALGLPLGRVRRASKGILHTRNIIVAPVWDDDLNQTIT